MKRNPSDLPTGRSERLLLLSDGKPGHVNQSIAFARHLGRDYDLCRVHFNSRLAKGCSYLCDRFGLRASALFTAEAINGTYAAVVSTGSETYYANRVLARRLGAKSVAIMLPKGYRYDFDLIVAQQHDNPPVQTNILPIPINLTFPEPRGVVTPRPGARYVSLIIGGNSAHCRLESAQLRSQLEQIRALFPDHRFWLTTSRRTPPEIEQLLKEFEYDEAVYVSERQVNPIADFLLHSDYVFLTADSTSMISEAVSFGQASVEVLPLAGSPRGQEKFKRFFQLLLERGSLHVFNGQIGQAGQKVDLGHVLGEVRL